MNRTDALIPVRLLGGVTTICGFGAFVAGIANTLHPPMLRDVRFLIPVGLYFIATGIGTVLLKRFAAVMLTVPLAVLGLMSIIASIRSGSAAAILLNLLFAGTIMCGPAVLVYRSWSRLR